MAKFAVGEIAVTCGSPLGWNGLEVTITVIVPKHVMGYDVYCPLRRSQHPTGEWWVEEARLRKRPPPPDWNALADPQHLPVEELA
jgi:hypothetical protein